MPKYYAIVGQSLEVIDNSKKPTRPKGYIKMKYESPSPEHIASDTGDWILPEPQPVVTANETDTENAS
ncbi:hypothetical protein DM558_00540 [Entomomonas moraniae]|uniref:Uncharacterized protein n=1 Tax=Entomomonas moraniae TaxID=2213226 RepID=A0A3Q9JH20_9GAMM|nr:hypothetical protein [Entomomonas moraniae]AZS49356.1 hypothetical protein DM558_00540 [Entomomonas moraniae]